MVNEPAAFGYALLLIIGLIAAFTAAAVLVLWLWEDVWRFPTQRFGEWWDRRKNGKW